MKFRFLAAASLLPVTLAQACSGGSVDTSLCSFNDPCNECANGRRTGTAPDQICNQVPGNGDTCGITCNDPNDAVTQFDTFIQGDTTTHFQCLGGIDCDSAHVACATPSTGTGEYCYPGCSDRTEEISLPLQCDPGGGVFTRSVIQAALDGGGCAVRPKCRLPAGYLLQTFDVLQGTNLCSNDVTGLNLASSCVSDLSSVPDGTGGFGSPTTPVCSSQKVVQSLANFLIVKGAGTCPPLVCAPGWQDGPNGGPGLANTFESSVTANSPDASFCSEFATPCPELRCSNEDLTLTDPAAFPEFTIINAAEPFSFYDNVVINGGGGCVPVCSDIPTYDATLAACSTCSPDGCTAGTCLGGGVFVQEQGCVGTADPASCSPHCCAPQTGCATAGTSCINNGAASCDGQASCTSPAGTFGFDSEGCVTGCPANCDVCDDGVSAGATGDCTVCSSGYVLLEGGTCKFGTCPTGQHSGTVSVACQDCGVQAGCSTDPDGTLDGTCVSSVSLAAACKNDEQCTTPAATFGLDLEGCVTGCLADCDVCDDGVRPRETGDCTECSAGFVLLSQGTCATACPVGEDGGTRTVACSPERAQLTSGPGPQPDLSSVATRRSEREQADELEDKVAGGGGGEGSANGGTNTGVIAGAVVGSLVAVTVGGLIVFGIFAYVFLSSPAAPATAGDFSSYEAGA